MRYRLLMLTALMCSLGSFAQDNKKVKQKTVDALSTDIKKNAIDPIDNEIQSLQDKIDAIKLQIEQIKNRKFTSRSGCVNIQELLSGYETLSDIYDDRDQLREVLESDESDMAQTYLLAIDMRESLEKVYNEDTNTRLVERSSACQTVLPRHKEAFDELVMFVNDYNYYMFELARLFVAADEDNYKTNAMVLTVREDAPYLMYVPYTKKVLMEYIRKGGVLPLTYKLDLKRGCPDAFSGLK